MKLMRWCQAVLLATLTWSACSFAKSDLDYLPDNVTYDPSIPKPHDVLGAPVGEWHVRHDQLVAYMQALAAASPRVTLAETGRTHENRPLLLLTITSEKNHANIDAVRQRHLAVIERGEKPAADSPLVIWMGYSVHGDEASGSNASMLVAYYLAAAQGDAVDALLNDNVVLLDPSLNPDGLSRFAQWANMHRGATLVADSNHREHQQDWPSGRTNHYWFDLNRDWLMLVHPESRARVKQFHQWRPHVLTDFHEMGTNSSYFFQPGIPSRKNPWTPDSNVSLTETLGQFHAEALDAEGQLYFTQEAFDDFYYGKGSTYPDALGSVGILFEQASARGHVQESINGDLHFSDAIQNQVTTSLSTFRGALANKASLLEHQRAFSEGVQALVKDDDVRGYLVSSPKDESKLAQFVSLLEQHNIRVNYLARSAKTDAASYEPATSVYVPVDQPAYRLIKSIFSERQRFNDNTFYDVSNWNLALAFNFVYESVERAQLRRLELSESPLKAPEKSAPTAPESAYAYAFAWHDAQAPALLQRLLAEDVSVRVAGKPFAATTSMGQVSFAAGTVVIPTGLTQPANLKALVHDNAAQRGIELWSITSGLTSQGIDLGSRHMRPVTMPRVLLVGGRGTSQYEAGEAWHYLDTVVGMPVTLVELERLGTVNLDTYSHILWVDGNYASVPESVEKRLGRWLRQGGVMIGQKRAARWFSDVEWLKAEFVADDDLADLFTDANLSYADMDAFEAKQLIAGAAYRTSLDLSHPLAFGYTREALPVFRNSSLVMKRPETPFVTVSRYAQEPLIAGYSADELQRVIANSAAVVAHRVGRGRVIALVDNPSFRGYWLGTRRLLSNAIYLSGFIDAEG